MTLFANSTGSIGQSVIYQNSSGYIGIGTTTPASLLDVNGTLSSTDLSTGALTATSVNAGSGPITTTGTVSTGTLTATGVSADSVTGDTVTVNDSFVYNDSTLAEQYISGAGQIVTKYQRSGRYTMKAGAGMYGRSMPVPQTVMDSYCGDIDGCQVTVCMQQWDNDTQTERACQGPFPFNYYITAPHRWRLNIDLSGAHATGQDADGVLGHAVNAWDACFFTDAEYDTFTVGVDSRQGMNLLVWGGHAGPNRICYLIIDD